ncbi:hypothetical protein HPB52_011777 [Rhipicephalus sanguineus]|uniref:Uncharacterized protein n=1 Tax=Rhipicephalus sanguineus TaxID=34632 RepID=A0A9D4T1X3_RHISA|nr:hypothetical protein HPB52_011777 [Rhipicephalus sanguineus]
MATATQRGYDPAAMVWTEIDVQQAAATGNGPTNIEDEGLFQLVALRRKTAQRKMMPKPAAVNSDGLAFNGRARTVHPKSKLIKWCPRDTPKMSADDIIVVLKPRETLHLKTAFQTGDLGAAIAQYVGGKAAATLNVWAVWTQNLIVCGTQHVEVANKLARDWNLNVGSGSVLLRGHVKLSGEEGDFSPLDTSNAVTPSKVSTWAAVASSSPSTVELELKKEIALLRTKNEQLAWKAIALQNVRAEPPLPGTLDSGDESASLCSGMGSVTYGPLINNLESRMTALEKSVADQIALLPTMIEQIIQAQMQQLVTTLTQQITAAVTQNVKSWIQASPKLLRQAGPVKRWVASPKFPAILMRMLPKTSGSFLPLR